jgi:hypothetical protein
MRPNVAAAHSASINRSVHFSAIANPSAPRVKPGQPWIGITNGTHLRAADGTPGKYVAFWGSCKSRASELLGREAQPGIDHALTEVVHCGSQHEIGVVAAASECVPRYLDRVMRNS